MTTAMFIIWAAVFAAVTSYAIANFVAAKPFLLDRPNERSSHRAATPRAGGFAIFGGFAVAIAYYALQQSAGAEQSRALTISAFGFAAFALGAIDDAVALGARLKLLVQIAIAVGFVAIMGPVASIPAPFIGELSLGVTAFPLTAFWIVAFMNAYNFMDGVNGIAGACGVLVLAALAAASSGYSGGVTAISIFLAAALFGYLPLNFISGRLFMGDSGSQFTGFMIAALAVLSGEGHAEGEGLSRMFVPIAFLPFIFDVAFTLVHRIARGRNILAAHNEHLYQLMVRLGASHIAVTTLYVSLVAISAAAAAWVNGRSSLIQYGAALALIALFGALAVIVYRRAVAADLLPGKSDDAPASASDAELRAKAANPAE